MSFRPLLSGGEILNRFVIPAKAGILEKNIVGGIGAVIPGEDPESMIETLVENLISYPTFEDCVLHKVF